MLTAETLAASSASTDGSTGGMEGRKAISYLSHGSGPLSWFFTLDHKRIGLMYLAAVSAALLLGTVLALLVRTEGLSPGPTIMSAETYGVLFTLHGVVMVFLVLLPSIPACFGTFVVPMMLGAADVAFPRLTLFAFHVWVLGAGSMALSALLDAIDTGWTFYVPYSTDAAVGTRTAVISAAVGVLLLGCSAALNGMGLIATIHKKRPPIMPWLRLPLFLWAIYCTAVVQVLVTPALCVAMVLLGAHRLNGPGMLETALGRDPLSLNTLFWSYAHPAVFVMILPAMGVVSEIICIYSRKRIFDYRSVALSSVAIAVLAVLAWGQHTLLDGQSELASVVFSALALLVAAPYAVMVLNWLATLHRGSLYLATPMLYALAFVFLFSIAALTGAFLGALGTHVQLHNTYFDVAQFHYFVVGGTLTGFLGALHHWWPKMLGRMYSEAFSRIACFLVFAGINTTFFPLLVLGARGMPRRHYGYVPEAQWLQQLSTVGSYLLALGLLTVAGCLLHSLVRGREAPANPWGGASVEWQCGSPPPPANFARPPTLTDPYGFSG